MTDVINAGFTPAPPWLTGNLQTVADRIRPRQHDLGAVSSEQPHPRGHDRRVGRLARRAHTPPADRSTPRPAIGARRPRPGRVDRLDLRAGDDPGPVARRVRSRAGGPAGGGGLVRALPDALPRWPLRGPALRAARAGRRTRCGGCRDRRLLPGRERHAQAPRRVTGGDTCPWRRGGLVTPGPQRRSRAPEPADVRPLREVPGRQAEVRHGDTRDSPSPTTSARPSRRSAPSRSSTTSSPPSTTAGAMRPSTTP